MSEPSLITIAIPLIGGERVTFEGKFPISQENWEQAMVVLAAMKPGLVESPPLLPEEESGEGQGNPAPPVRALS